MNIDSSSKKVVLIYIDMFKKRYLKGQYKDMIKEREDRIALFEKYFSKEFLKSMNEYDFGEMISKLWASEIWSNKDYLVQRILKDNGIEKLRISFIDLLYGQEPFEKRFDAFRKNIKGIGPASLTEILCYFNPKEYGIWNDKARSALRKLGLGNVVPVDKYQISGMEYSQFNELCKYLASELERAKVPEIDLLIVDFYLYEVWKSRKDGEVFKETQFDHNEIRDYIRDIGIWLGFEAETEKTVGKGAKVDVVWQARIANLGVVTYVFEVHKRGAIDSLLLNLQKAISNPTVQKVIAVSDVDQIEKINKEAAGLPENFRKSLTYWDAIEVKQIHEKLREVVISIERLDLVRSEFGE